MQTVSSYRVKEVVTIENTKYLGLRLSFRDVVKQDLRGKEDSPLQCVCFESAT